MDKVKLGDICDLKSSKRIFESEYVESGIPFVRGLEISDGTLKSKRNNYECYISCERYEELKDSVGVPKIGDVLITAVGTIGNLYLVEDDYEFYFKDGNVIWLSNLDKSVIPEYLFYFLQSPYFKKQLEYALIGAVQKALTIVMLKEIEVILPEIDEQRRIASLLSNLDNKIGNNQKLIKELEDTARLIYDYWFTQFDFPDENGKPYRSSGGKMVWNDELKREIPEGWDVKRLREIASLLKSTVQPKADVVYEHYSIPAFDDGKYPVFEPGSLIDSGKYLITENSLLYSRLNPKFKRLWVPLCLSENLICSTEFLVFEPANAAVRSFVYGVLDSSTYYAYMVSKAISSTGSRSRVDPQVAIDFVVPIPDECLLMRFGNVLSPMLKQIKDLQIQIEELVSLRGWLLPMLMNGQVKVS